MVVQIVHGGRVYFYLVKSCFTYVNEIQVEKIIMQVLVKICKAFNPTHYFGNKRMPPSACFIVCSNYICLIQIPCIRSQRHNTVQKLISYRIFFFKKKTHFFYSLCHVINCFCNRNLASGFHLYCPLVVVCSSL